MTTLLLDGERATIEGRPETLADLLAHADSACARRGRIVTALRLDGADEPAFREPQVLSRGLATLDAVEIESGTPAELALTCLSEAGLALHALAAAAGDVARRLRAGELHGANRDLVAVAEGLATVLTITGAASLGLGIDLGARDTPHGTISAISQRTAGDLDAIIAAQMAADWNAVADRLDNALVPNLRAWGEVCGGLELEADLAIPVSRLHFPDPVR